MNQATTTQPQADAAGATSSGNGVTAPTVVPPGATVVTTPAPSPVAFTPEQQAAIDNMFTQRIAENTRKTEEAATKKQQEADAAAEQERLVKAGEFETIAKKHVKTIESKDAEIATLKAQLAARDTAASRDKIATDNGLPAGWGDRLKGSTDEELIADAKKLAETVKAPVPPNHEVNNTNQNTNVSVVTPQDKAAGDARVRSAYRV